MTGDRTTHDGQPVGVQAECLVIRFQILNGGNHVASDAKLRPWRGGNKCGDDVVASCQIPIQRQEFAASGLPGLSMDHDDGRDPGMEITRMENVEPTFVTAIRDHDPLVPDRPGLNRPHQLDQLKWK
jgi:hypothetical protein